MSVLIKDNQKYLDRIQVLLDALAIIITYILAWYIKFESPLKLVDVGVGVLSKRVYFSALIFIVPGYLLLNYMHHKFDHQKIFFV